MSKGGVELVSHSDYSDFSREITEELNGFYNENDLQSLVDDIAKRALELTPRDTGELQESQYRFVETTTQGMAGEIGYTAPHAVFVHEIPADHTRGNNPPEARDQYLTVAAREVLAKRGIT